MKDVELWYLGHSGYAVRTDNHFLVFDYYINKQNTYKENTLEYGYLNPDEIKDLNIIIFASHRHHDHYYRQYLKWRDTIPNIKYIFGWNNNRVSDVINLLPNTSTQIGDIKVSTMKSTDEGVGFLVEVDGITIFHAGDHANWEDNEPGVSYYDEIDFISNTNNSIDIAFIPATTFYGERPACLTEGAFYAIKKLNPKVTFPMHGNNREYLYKEFKNDAAKENIANLIMCPEKIGDKFIYNNGNCIKE